MHRISTYLCPESALHLNTPSQCSCLGSCPASDRDMLFVFSGRNPGCHNNESSHMVTFLCCSLASPGLLPFPQNLYVQNPNPLLRFLRNLHVQHSRPVCDSSIPTNFFPTYTQDPVNFPCTPHQRGPHQLGPEASMPKSCLAPAQYQKFL